MKQLIKSKQSKQNFMQFNNNFSNGTSSDPYPIHNPTVYDPYRLSHNELRQVIVKQTLRLEELKRLYEKEQKILSQTYRDRIPYDCQGNSRNDHSFGRNSFYNPASVVRNSDHLNISPIKNLSSTVKKQPPIAQVISSSNKQHREYNTYLNPASYSHRIQYDQPDSSLMNSQFGKIIQEKSSRNQKNEPQRFESIEERLKNVQRTIKSRKIDQKNQQKVNLTNKFNKENPQKNVQNQVNKSKPKRRIVYDSPEKSPQKQPENTTPKQKQTKPEQTNDSIIAQINVQSKITVDQTSNSKINKTQSTKKLKTKSKSTLFIRPKSHINLKSKFTHQPLTLHSKINQIIDHRLLMLSCVFKDTKWRNQKNQKDFLLNRFQMEEKGRKQIKSLVNNDTLVLKKHKMVVN